MDAAIWLSRAGFVQKSLNTATGPVCVKPPDPDREKEVRIDDPFQRFGRKEQCM